MTWVVSENGFDKAAIVSNGNKFIIGNGYMGYRGTLEEYTKSQLVACNLSNIYDKNGDNWREPINAPNGLFTEIFVNGRQTGLPNDVPVEHMQMLDLKQGIHKRCSVWDAVCGRLEVKAERFACLAETHLICLKYTVRAEKSCQLTIRTGIDGDVWDINGPHLEDYSLEEENGIISILTVTRELGIPVSVAEVCKKGFEAAEVIERNEKGIFRLISFKAEPETNYTFYKYVSVYTGNDGYPDIREKCGSIVLKAAAVGYSGVCSVHAASWKDRWEMSDVIIEGDKEDQLALRYSIYQLQIIAPAHSRAQSIPARGLSGQTYKGAIFWDTEMFMLPFFLHTAPEVAKSLVNYRIRTLDGARRKAEYYGCRGAFYAWESQESGEDACSDFNVTDIFTGRPVRTYFRDKQIHISAAVAYAIWEFYEFTGDTGLLLDGGAEAILECARFYYSYACYKEDKDRYELLDVIGPDEYHERVNNNAYTNKIVHHTLNVAIKVIELLKRDYPEEYEQLMVKLDYHKDIYNISKLREKLYIPEPDDTTLVIEQFDGYSRLEDCSLDEVRSRLLDPREYWGGGHGVASNTKIIKQADVVFMLYLFGKDYSKEVLEANWTYYEPKTEHGSSLSPCIYSLLSCEIGNIEWAYPFFVKSANIDLSGESKQYAGSIYIGGTHPAASGGAWMAAILGFAGLKVKEGTVSVRPRLPSKWSRLAFKVIVRGVKYQIDITQDYQQIMRI